MRMRIALALILASFLVAPVSAQQRGARATPAYPDVAAATLALVQAELLAAHASTAALTPHMLGVEMALAAAQAGIGRARAGLEIAARAGADWQHTLDALQPVFPAARHGAQDPADSLWRVGRESLNRNEFTRAVETFRRIRTESRFERSGYRPEAYYWEAFALSRTATPASLRQARELLTEMLRTYPRDERVRDAEGLAAQIDGLLARAGDETAARATASRATATPAQCPRDADEDVRLTALNALIQMGAANALPVLRDVMARRDECAAPLRRRAVMLIAQSRSAEAAGILVDVARNDPDAQVRSQAVFFLSQVPGDEAVAALDQILRDSNDARVQQSALFALAQNRSSRAGEILRRYAARTDIDKGVRRQAIFALSQHHDTANTDFLRTLYGQLTDGDLKDQVLFAVAQHRGEGSDTWLMEIALNAREDMNRRRQALFMAGQHGLVDVARLAQLYDSMQDRDMKRQIAFTLAQRTEPAAVDKLLDIARREQDAELRRNAIFWLGQSKDPRVVQFLTDLIRN